MNNNKNSGKWFVLASYMYLAAFTQIYWLNFSAIDTFIEAQFKLSTYEIMWLSLVFVVVTIILSIPVGIFIDHYGFKTGVSVGAVCIGIFPFVRLLAPYSFTMLMLSQLGIAISQPFIQNSVTKLAILWFKSEEEALAVGLGTLALFIGMMISVGVTPWLVEKYNYESMLLIYAILSLLGAIIFIIFVKEYPKHFVNIKQNVNLNHTNISELKHILKIKNFVILSILAMFGMGIFTSLITWLQKILHDLHNISLINGGMVSSMLTLSGIIGCVVIPMISDKINRRKPFLILAIFVSFFCITYLIYENNYYNELANTMLLGFFLIPAFPIALTMSAEITGQQYVGIAVGFIQFMGNIGSMILIYLFEAINNMTGSFVIPLLILDVILVISLILVCFLHDYKKT